MENYDLYRQLETQHNVYQNMLNMMAAQDAYYNQLLHIFFAALIGVLVFSVVFAVLSSIFGIGPKAVEAKLIKRALEESDPVVRQLKVDKAMKYSTSTFVERAVIRKAIMG